MTFQIVVKRPVLDNLPVSLYYDEVVATIRQEVGGNYVSLPLKNLSLRDAQEYIGALERVPGYEYRIEPADYRLQIVVP